MAHSKVAPPRETTRAFGFAHGRAGAVVVALVALVTCVAGLRNGFAHDDVLIVLGDPRIRSAGHWLDILTNPYWPPPFRQDLYRPLATLLLKLEFAVGGGSPLAFRVASYGMNVAASLGVLALARRLLSPTPALIVALLFAVHPVHVEAIALGVNQNELLVALIACVAVARYIDWRRANAMTALRWAAIAALYVAAMLLKEHGFVLLGLLAATELLLVDTPSSEKRRAVLRPLALLFGLAVVVAVVRMIVLSNLVGTFTAEALVGLGIGGRALTMLSVVPEWLRLFAWPAHLRADYSPHEFVASTGFGQAEVLGLAIVVLTLGLFGFTRKRAPSVAFGILWCIVALLPVSNVIMPTGILIAERTLFLASIGFLIAVCATADWLLTARLANATPGLSPALCGVGALLVVGGAVRSSARQHVWRNDGYLWLASAADAPRSFRVQYALGDVLFDLGRRREAIDAYERAIAAAPEPWTIRNDLARRLREIADDDEAIIELRRSLEENSRQPAAEAELVAALIATGRYELARRQAAAARAATPQAPIFYGLERIADSAITARAPAGSVRLRILNGSENLIRRPAD